MEHNALWSETLTRSRDHGTTTAPATNLEKPSSTMSGHVNSSPQHHLTPSLSRFNRTVSHQSLSSACVCVCRADQAISQPNLDFICQVITTLSILSSTSISIAAIFTIAKLSPIGTDFKISCQLQ
ncbi:hypothetical protein TNCV_1586301 [Trichonephila clavipes]|nr:hypothetical protein TNCV_1586301 [Trichonephila clavipes]